MEDIAMKLAERYGKELFEKHLRTYAPQDPMYESYVDARGKTKRRKREVPPGLSKRDAKILKSVKRRAHYLDKGFSFCGLRFGWTFVIGIIPFAGDVTDAVLNYTLIVRKAKQAEIPGWLLRRMLANNAVSAGVGAIPFVGDVVLATFKANSRNAWLLEEFLRIRGEEFLKAQAKIVDPAQREDPKEVKPGAGKEPGEVLPGTAAAATNNGTGSALKKKGTGLGSLFKKKDESLALVPVGNTAVTAKEPSASAASTSMPGAMPQKKTG